MKTTIKIFTLIVILLATFSSCYEGVLIEGNNEVTEETRPIPDFNQVYSAGSFNIFYTIGDSSSVRIECESNLLPYIETVVYDKKLNIQFRSDINVSTHQDINVYVTNPSVKKLQLAGSGNVVADSLIGDNVELSLSGSGNIYSKFYGRYIESSVSGSGNIQIYGECDTIETSISGSGTIELETPACLFTSVSISGSGKADLKGSAYEEDLKIEGSGKIKAYDFPVKRAEVLLGGSGSVQVNVSEKLNAIISGSGNVYYIGNPQINFSDNGSGKLINQN